MTENQAPSKPSECPSTKRLRDWLDGNYELSSSDQEHVESCERCSLSLRQLSDDENLQALSNVPHDSKSLFTDEPEFERLQVSLRSIPLGYPLTKGDASNFLPASTERGGTEPTQGDAPVLDVPSIELLNRRLPAGRFVVDRLLAYGGTGAVYLAYDQRLHREVAIKVLARDSHRDRKRFLREARVLAELEHANIVRVFDFGILSREDGSRSDSAQVENSGQLYLVMEYVSGGTANLLTAALSGAVDASADKGELGTLQTPVRFQQLAKLLASAADGLSAAHAKSLIHRDVKPGNMLLSADWSMLKIADFGLARFSDSDGAQVTQTGDILGTPAFMSPEQVFTQENLSPSTDIYSLGASLYQILTGELPFRGNSAAVLRQIAEATPVAPHLLNASIPLDLEIICLHAMEKKPASRYATMQAMADDLRRFAAGEPIHARPTSTLVKAIRLLSKNRSLAAALVACLFLLITLTLGSVTTAIILSYQSARLSASIESEKKAKVAAQESFRKSIEAADQLLLSVTEEAELLPRAPGSEEVSKKLLKRAQNYYKEVIESGSGSDLVQFDAARAHSGLAQIALRAGKPEDVEDEARASLRLLDSIPLDVISTAERVALKAKTLGFLGKALATRGDLARAVEVFTEAVDACQAERKSDRQNLEIDFLLADSLRGRAVAENMAGDATEAEASLLQSQSLFDDLIKAVPDEPRYLRLAAGCQSTMAVTLVRREGYAAAKKHLLQANEYLSRLEVDGQLPIRLRSDRAVNIVTLASVEFHLGNLDESRALFTRAEEEYQQLSTLEPKVIEHQYKGILTVFNSANVDVAMGTVDLVLERYKLLVPRLQGLLVVDPNSREYLGMLGLVEGNIAIFLRMLGRTEEAIESLAVSEETLRRYAELIDNTPDSLQAIAFNQFQISKCYLQLNKIDEGLEAVEESTASTEAILAKHPDFLPSRIHKVDILIGKCDLLSAREKVDAKELLAVAQKALNESTALLAGSEDLHESKVAHGLIHSILSDAYFQLDQLDKALEFSEKGIAHLKSFATDLRAESTMEAFRYNYLEQARVYAARLRSSEIQASENRAELRKRLEELLVQCKEMGASEEELAKLQVPTDEP